MPVELKTGVGRIVWGNPGKTTIKKDQTTKQPVMRDGKPVEQWAFGVAFPKAEFQQMIWPYMAQEAATGYPNGVPPKFSWKYVDGDGVDSQGKPYNQREGYAGCYILTITTEAFAPPIFKLQNGAYIQLTGDQIKTGDYVVCAINLKVNVPTDRTHTPGLYVNPVAIEHVGYGQPIFNGPDAQTLFGGATYQLPPGASATPVATTGAPGMPGTMAQQPMQPQPGGMPGYSGAPGYAGQAPGAAPGGMPGAMPQQQPMQPQPQPGMMPGMMPPPAHDFTQNAGMHQPGFTPQAAQPAPGAAPMMAPGGYAPTPGTPATGYPSNGMMPNGAMQPQPGGMPGMMPPR